MTATTADPLFDSEVLEEPLRVSRAASGIGSRPSDRGYECVPRISIGPYPRGCRQSAHLLQSKQRVPLSQRIESTWPSSARAAWRERRRNARGLGYGRSAEPRTSAKDSQRLAIGGSDQRTGRRVSGNHQCGSQGRTRIESGRMDGGHSRTVANGDRCPSARCARQRSSRPQRAGICVGRTDKRLRIRGTKSPVTAENDGIGAGHRCICGSTLQ